MIIDTALEEAIIALSKDDKIIAELANKELHSHASFIQVAIANLLAEQQMAISALDAIAVTLGPGSYTGLTTATAVTVTTGTKALVIITTEMSHGTNSEQLWASWAVSGATTSASADSRSVFLETPSTGILPRVQTFTRGYIQTGLTAGSNTFTMQFKVGGGTGSFGNRSISVVDMGS